LINGASGGVGTFAVQLAKSFGAEVTGVCSTRNLELVRSIGAEHVVDYTQEDFAQTEQRYDLVFDVVAKRSFSDCRRALSPNGVYVTTEFSPLLALRGQLVSLTGSQRMVPLQPKPPDKTDLVFMKDLLEAGRMVPVIDRRYTLHEVPEALRYLAKGHARGKVVISVSDEAR
jgi:NADPH:quinone reductase-like Zn-dependent oxidoreductase